MNINEFFDLPQNFTKTQLKKSFINMVKIYHPDNMNITDDNIMKNINEYHYKAEEFLKVIDDYHSNLEIPIKDIIYGNNIEYNFKHHNQDFKITIKIKRNLKYDTILRFKNKLPNGKDIYLKIVEPKNQNITIINNDILMKIGITYLDLLLKNIDINLPDKKINIKIDSNCIYDHKIRIVECGLYGPKKRGDIILSFYIKEILLTDKEKNILEILRN